MADIGADSTAIAWAIAKNQERENSFKQQKSAYRKGVVNGNKGNNSGKLSEKVAFPQDDPSFEFGDPSGFDGDDPSTYMTEPGILDLSKGIWFRFVGADRPDLWRTAHIFIESHSRDEWLNNHTLHFIEKDYPHIVVTDQSGKTIADSRFGDSGGDDAFVYSRIVSDSIGTWTGIRCISDQQCKILKYRIDSNGHLARGYREYHNYYSENGIVMQDDYLYEWDVAADLHCQEVEDENGRLLETVYAGASTEDPGEIT